MPDDAARSGTVRANLIYSLLPRNAARCWMIQPAQEKEMHLSRRILSAFLTLACCLFGCALRADETPQEPQIKYPASAEFVVLERTTVGMVALDPEQRPFLRIYGNGRVHLRRNPYLLRNPGDFEAYLSHADLRVLLSLCARKGLMEFDRQAVKREHEVAERALMKSGSVPVISDAAQTTLVIRLAEYVPAGSEAATKDFEKTLSWHGLSETVTWYPEVKSLVRFKELIDVLASIEEATIDAAKRGETSIWLPSLEEKQ